MEIETILVAAIGGVFGGGITLIVTYMQSKNNLKRDYLKIAHDLALEEYRTAFEVAKLQKSRIHPIEANMAYYTLFIQELKKKDFSVEKLKEFRKVHIDINKVYD